MDGAVNRIVDLTGVRVLVTGHTGFKGSWLSYWLNILGADVYGYALKPKHQNDLFLSLKLDQVVDHMVGDIRDSKSLEDRFRNVKPDLVFHLAAQPLVRQSYKDPKETFEINISGSVNVLDAVRSTPSVKALVYVTSDKCYKNVEQNIGYIESDQLGGDDPYSASKAAAEIVFAAYRKSFFSGSDTPGLVSVRAGNVIGGGDWSDDRIIPDCIRSLQNNKAITIRNPKATRPWQHVLDPLNGYLMVASKLLNKSGQVSSSYNFGPSANDVHPVEVLVKKVITNWGSGEVIIESSANNPHEAELLQLDSSLARHELGWSPKWDFATTLSETVRWYYEISRGGDPRKLCHEQIDLFTSTQVKVSR